MCEAPDQYCSRRPVTRKILARGSFSRRRRALLRGHVAAGTRDWSVLLVGVRVWRRPLFSDGFATSRTSVNGVLQPRARFATALGSQGLRRRRLAHPPERNIPDWSDNSTDPVAFKFIKQSWRSGLNALRALRDIVLELQRSPQTWCPAAHLSSST